MGTKKRFGFLIVLTLLVMPMVFALDTPIKVITNPELDVTIRVLNINGSGTLEGGDFLDQPSGDDGIVEVVFSSEAINSNKIDISIMLKKGGSPQKFSDGSSVRKIDNNGEHMKSGWPIEIDITVDPPVLIKAGRPVEEVVNTTEETVDTGTPEVNNSVEENTEEIEADTQPGITGKAINVERVFTSKVTYYIIGGLVLVFLIILIVKKKLDSKDGKSKYLDFKIKKDGKKKEDEREEEKEKKMSNKEELEDAEKKLEEAKKELEEVKVKDEREEKIRAAKSRFEMDKAALDELEKE